MKKLFSVMFLLLALSVFLFAGGKTENKTSKPETTVNTVNNTTTNNVTTTSPSSTSTDTSADTNVSTTTPSTVSAVAPSSSFLKFGDLVLTQDYEPVTNTEKFFAAMGNDIMSGYASYYTDMDFAAFIKGILDYQMGIKYSYDEIDKIVQDYNEEKASGNLKIAEDFLAENAKKEGVVVTESGLQYQVVSSGNGVRPADGDTVTFDYELRLSNDEVQDSSYDRGEPLTIGLDNLIQGMIEGLKLMDEGSHYIFWIHPDLGYGSSQSSVPANSLLIFDVELISIGEPEVIE